jgi:hypothetical protein
MAQGMQVTAEERSGGNAVIGYRPALAGMLLNAAG